MDNGNVIAIVEAALCEVRPMIEMHGGNVELVKIEDAKVYVRLIGSCIGCPASLFTLKLGIEQTIKERLPEIQEVIPVF